MAPLVLRLKRGQAKPVTKGCPWVFAGALNLSSEHMLSEPGALAELRDHKGRIMGLGYFNPRAALAFRMLSSMPQPIDTTFFEMKLRAALHLREKHFTEPYYRLVHSDADGLPGLIIDRFSGICVLQVATAGMDRLLPHIIDALDAVISPKTIILRNDIPARALEGLPQDVRVVRGSPPARVDVHENGCVYFADVMEGQKTGWFYDQRQNRAMIAEIAHDRSVLDLYCHTGGFGILAAKHGARRVTMVDSSKHALELARATMNQYDFGELCTLRQGDARKIMNELHDHRQRYGVVIVDPPAFVKRKENISAGMAAYEQLSQEAALLVEDAGYLFIASCSHHASRPRFRQAVLTGIKEAGRIGVILHYTGHPPDHPVHPQLPQSEYLKGLLVRCHLADAYDRPI